jgi:hypothetical protein
MNDLNYFTAKLEIYLTHNELNRLLDMMDVDIDHRIEEKEFIEFFITKNMTVIKKAERLKDSANKLRSYLRSAIAGVGTNIR